MTEQERINARLDEIFGEGTGNEDELLSNAITSLQVLQTLCESPMEEVRGSTFASVTAFQDATKGIVEAAVNYLEGEVGNRKVEPPAPPAVGRFLQAIRDGKPEGLTRHLWQRAKQELDEVWARYMQGEDRDSQAA